MAEFWIGTSGWHYEHWRGRFYPEEIPKSGWLGHYMRHFRTVELNASFYRQPKEKTWDGWREAAPEGFRYAVKANRFITHIQRLKDCAAAVERFMEGALRLGERLGPVLYQLPPGFHRTDENAERLDAFLSVLPAAVKNAIEFRHKSWFGPETAAQLKRRGAAFCSFDMPRMECPLVVTAPFAYMRFHGSAERYASNYTDEMLTGWATRLRRLGEEVDEVYIYFNNDAQAFAVRNALKLAEILRG